MNSMLNKKYTNLVTPIGTSWYSSVEKTEEYAGSDTGKYTASVRLPYNVAKELIVKLQKAWKEFSDANPNLKYADGTIALLGLRKDGDDVIVKTKSKLQPKIVDAKVKAMEPVELGNNSKIRISFTASPFYMSSRIYGLSLLLKAVQVVEYAPPESSSSEFEEIEIADTAFSKAVEEDLQLDKLPF